MNNNYIINSFRAPKVVNDYIQNLLSNYNKSTREFFIHILFGTLHTIKRDEEGWVPVSSELMKREWGRLKPDWRQLKEDKLIEIKTIGEDNQDYSKIRGLSREFRIDLTILNSICEKFPEIPIKEDSYNLFTGDKARPYRRHKLTTDNNQSIPKLIRESILSIDYCIVNFEAIIEHLYDLHSDSLLSKPGSTENRRYINDKYCYRTLLDRADIIDTRFLKYYPSYRMQPSGRISEFGGCMQSCTRKMKAAAFSNIPDVRNYDLKSSQVYGLIQWFEFANIDSSWLHTYLTKPKSDYASAIGISVDCWKSCFLSLVMNAYLPKKVDKNMLDKDISILNYLMKEANNDTDKALEYYCRFYKVVEPLTKNLSLWNEWLVKEYIPMTSYMSAGKTYVKNRTGAHICLDDYRKEDGRWININKFKRVISAFYLQGLEACFIHYLTIVSKHYNYITLSNQHDGLVVIGKIPEEAIKFAREQSGLKYAFLEEKPFI